MASQTPPTSHRPSKLNPQNVTKAVNALLKKSKHPNPQNLDQDDDLYLILSLIKIPHQICTNPHNIPLPTPLHPFDETQDFCFIFNDLSKKRQKTLTCEFALKKIKSENIPITKVLKLSKLKSDYRAFEEKQKLCGSFDLFFAEKRVVPIIGRVLGKGVLKKTVPVELGERNWKEGFELACGSVVLNLKSGSGKCSVIKIGRVSMGREEIIGNVIAAVEGVVGIVPKRWGNVKGVHLKLTESLALPIYGEMFDNGDGNENDESVV